MGYLRIFLKPLAFQKTLSSFFAITKFSLTRPILRFRNGCLKSITVTSIKFFLIIQLYRNFIASFAFVLQTRRAKPIPLCRAGGTPAAFFDSRRSLRREPICKQMRPRPTVSYHYNINRQRKQHLCRNLFVGVIHESPVIVSYVLAGDWPCLHGGRPYEANILMRTSLRAGRFCSLGQWENTPGKARPIQATRYGTEMPHGFCISCISYFTGTSPIYFFPKCSCRRMAQVPTVQYLPLIRMDSRA